MITARPSDDLVTVDAAAKRLQVHPKTVLRSIHDGRLRATRIGKSYRIVRADLDAFGGVPVPSESPRAEARVTSIVDIEHVGGNLARKLSSSVTNALHSRPAGSGDLNVHVDYDEPRSQLRVVVHGSPDDTASLLGLIAIWVDQLTP